MKVENIHDQYEEGRMYLTRRKLRWVSQLILANNLNRGDENIASSSLLSLFNRVLSNLYKDKMSVKFVPAEDGDQRKTELLNKLAVNDYREMEKDRLDYDWLWDALFFGRGYCETLGWDHERKIMKPRVINPLYLVYDPYFSDPQEWRYYGKWILRSRHAVERLIKEGIIDGVKKAEELPGGVEEELWSYKTRIDSARQGNAQTSFGTTAGASGPAVDSGRYDSLYQIYEHFAYDEDGEKKVFWTDKNFSKILFSRKLDLRDGKNGGSKWPLVVKEAFKMEHSDMPVSLTDIIEDKHRALNVLYNLAYVAAKDEANPLYVYNPNLVRDITQLFQRSVNQHIPVEDINAAIGPLNKEAAMSQSLIAFIQMLKTEMSDPLGTGITFQPTKKGKQSATEAALQQQLNEMSTSLQAKLTALSEKEFWSHWYQRIKRYTYDSDSKMMTILGVKGVISENLNYGELKTNYPPGVQIFSSKEAEFKELVMRRDLMQIYPAIEKSMDANGFRNWNKYVFMPKFLEDSSTLELVFPDSLDELKARGENELLNSNEFVDVRQHDDDQEHLYVHLEAKNTPAAWAHRFWHEEQRALKLKNQPPPAAAPPLAPGTKQKKQETPGNLTQFPTPGKSRTTNRQAAVPLQERLASTIGSLPKV